MQFSVLGIVAVLGFRLVPGDAGLNQSNASGPGANTTPPVLPPAVPGKGSPVPRVISLLHDLKAKIGDDRSTEQDSYNRFACWCEETLPRKAAELSATKDRIADLSPAIVQLNGDLAAITVESAQLRKDIDANMVSQREATKGRQREGAEYMEGRTEAEQCIGALEAAIKVLAGAGTGTGFLEALQEARLLSIVAGVRGVLSRPAASRAVSDADFEVARRFVDRPRDFVVHTRTHMLSTTQTAPNPFGEYAPKSTRIQGILKGMYDGFASDLESANAEEAEKKRDFDHLMYIKQQERNTLEASLDQLKLDKATKEKGLAEFRTELVERKEQLQAYKIAFAETKADCKAKAVEWAERTRLRIEEVRGISEAIEILSSPQAQDTFVGAYGNQMTFLQVPAQVSNMHGRGRSNAYERLRTLAAKFHSLSLADLTAEVRTGGHFDKVMSMIDDMVAVLRKQERDDIEHRDRCQNDQDKNTNDIAEITRVMGKSQSRLDQLNRSRTSLEAERATIQNHIFSAEKGISDLTNFRNGQRLMFERLHEHDADAIVLLNGAIDALSKFYSRNRIGTLSTLTLAQRVVGQVAFGQRGSPGGALGEAEEEAEEGQEAENPPKVAWQSADYGGRTSGTTGVVAILVMLKEGLQQDMATSMEDDQAGQADYEKEVKALRAVRDEMNRSLTATEQALAEIGSVKVDMQELRGRQESDLKGEVARQGVLDSDCAWVASHFQTRRDKRNIEINGLLDAKSYLSGLDSGANDALP